MVEVGEVYEAVLFEGEDCPKDLEFRFKILAEQQNDDGAFYLGAKILPDSDDFSVSDYGSTQWFDADGYPVDEVNKHFDMWFELIID